MGARAFVGGRVWTSGFSTSRALDVLVRDGRIIEVARAGDLDTPDAERVDLDGALLMPGFQDAHVHPGMAGQDLERCSLLGLETSDAIVAAITRYAAAHPEREWITGGGWLQRAFGASPTRELLDELVGGRKAALHAHSRHSIWASSAALAAAGITASTPDPEHGRIERDDEGNPSGLLHEAAMDLLTGVLPAADHAAQKAALLRAQQELLALGVTSIQDALIGEGLGSLDYHPAYLDLLAEGGLQQRVTAALWWRADRGIEQVADLVERRRALEALGGPDTIRADMVKIMVDGADVVILDRDALIVATTALVAEGFSVHYHSYGEASTRHVLDAIEIAAVAHPAARPRHHIAHLMVIAGEEFRRFAELDVTANIQGFWGDRPVHHDMLRPSQLTCDAHRREYAFSRLVMAGARLAAGSDWPVSSADPLDAARVVTSRRTRDGRDEPDELDRLDLPDILTAYTAGSAHVNGRPGTTGRIAPGFWADLVVIDHDILSDPAGLADARVRETWIAGERVFSR